MIRLSIYCVRRLKSSARCHWHVLRQWCCFYGTRRGRWSSRTRRGPLERWEFATLLSKHHETRTKHEKQVTDQAHDTEVTGGLIGGVLAFVGHGESHGRRDGTEDTEQYTENGGLRLRELCEDERRDGRDGHGHGVTQEPLQVLPLLGILDLATLVEGRDTDAGDRDVKDAHHDD